MARLQYAARNPGHYLLGEVVEDWDDELSFATGIHHVDDMSGSGLGLADDEMEPGMFVVRVEKSDRAAWVSFITVGRARNNDIVLRHPSISKLHAQIHREPSSGNDHSDAFGFKLVDAGSANGTKINGRRLARGEVSEIRNGDKVAFGDIVCSFLDAATLYDRLRTLPRDKL